MRNLSTTQYECLSNLLYETILNSDEDFGIGEMGDCRNSAKEIVEKWLAEEKIAVNIFTTSPSQITSPQVISLKRNIYDFFMSNDEMSFSDANNCFAATDGAIQQWFELSNIQTP